MPFPVGWTYRTKLTLSYTAFSPAGSLTNFPVPLVWNGTQATSNLPQALMVTDGSTPAKSDGSDIRLSLDKYGETPLAFELVSFGPTTTANVASAYCEIWVKLPTAYYNTNTTIYIWWGNSNAVALSATDTYGSYNVWDSSYNAVYHMNDASGNILDATTNQVSGTPSGSSFPNASSTYGKIRRGENFVSSNSNYVDCGNGTAFNYTTSCTVECWVNIQSFAMAWMALLTKGDTSWRLHRENTNNTLQFVCGSTAATTGTLSTGTWYHIVGRYDGTNCRIYVNGSRVATTASASIPTNTNAVRIGENSGATGRYFNGYMDEVRFSNIARSEGWIYAEYNTQNDPASYWAIGTVEIISNALSGWNRRCAIVNDRTKLGGDEYDIDVPFVWTGTQNTSNLPQEMMISGGLYSAKSDGSDIRFTTDPNGTEQMPFEIVSFTQNANSSLAVAEIWVRVKYLSSASNTTIYVWYNNPSATALDVASVNGQYAVWDPKASSRLYSEVYHMNGTGNVSDSTSNQKTATNNGTTSSSGKIGSARQFDGASSQYLSNITNLTVDDFSVAFWVKTTATSLTGTQWFNGTPIVSADSGWGSSVPEWSIAYLNSAVAFGINQTGGNDYTIISSATINDGNWHYVVCTRVRSTGALAVYIDGVSSATGSSHTVSLNSSSTINVGRFVSFARYFTGYVEEIWLMPITITSAQITSQYNSQNSPQTFWTLTSPTSRIFPAGWKWRARLTQDYTKNSGNQSNFVSLLAWTGSLATSCLPEAMMKANGPYAAKSDGSDIRITTDATGLIQLPFEIVVFSTNSNTANAVAEIYVKVPQVSSSVDTDIYIWWGAPDATAYRTFDTLGRNAVWTDYLMVFHFQNSLVDSTGNGFDATGVNSPTNVAGPIAGQSINFNSVSTQYAYTPSQPASINWLANGSFYITFWSYYESLTESYSRIFDFGSGAPLDNIFFGHTGTSTTSRFGCVNNTTLVVEDNTSLIVEDTWQFIGLRWTRTGLETDLNSDVASGATATSTPLRQAVRSNGYFGRSNYAADGYLTGRIDEFRVKRRYASLERVSDYNTASSPSTYWRVDKIQWVGLRILVNGAWKNVSEGDICIAGAYRSVADMKLLLFGAWRDIY